MNVIKSYSKLPVELKKRLKESYPDGYEDFIKRVQLVDGTYLAVPFMSDNQNYLIKLHRVSKQDEDDNDDYDSGEDSLNFDSSDDEDYV